MATVFLGIGTNIGNKKKNITDATIIIGSVMGEIRALSSLYETEPWGYESPNTFLNAVIQIETEIEPQKCLDIAKAIEREMGRVHTKEGYEDRIIDIDILFYDDTIYHSGNLTIPHPLIEKRDFVLRPMAEIAPDFRHPISGKTMKNLLHELNKKLEKDLDI
ncbi:MAG: 2-amino-4-hydroxy-6-hydroxymethyldihydropteridine diphosphokinase [Paludibacteraceae bacterium]|nr:2-amino-4-hydroxy-6-hydroxymethyldihydropteridine diphosphokinase [Paludibacteraceae bacterium]MBP5482401.1 2-amino-4-hydroxy-6-hydroxymethyldihydropteridine diphosphokinase [Paludibacteraceae bacterium]